MSRLGCAMFDRPQHVSGAKWRNSRELNEAHHKGLQVLNVETPQSKTEFAVPVKHHVSFSKQRQWSCQLSKIKFFPAQKSTDVYVRLLFCKSRYCSAHLSGSLAPSKAQSKSCQCAIKPSLLFDINRKHLLGVERCLDRRQINVLIRYVKRLFFSAAEDKQKID